MSDDQRLARYLAKRDLAVSGEPGTGSDRDDESPRFVVHRHEATRLHFDFRLEADGVLVSWAVPRGPSLDPGVKRLAILTEDHPLDYAHFEGHIPAGQYGAGTVIVWDSGTYRNLTQHHGKPVPIAQAIDEGHLTVWLDGTRLTGGFALTRTRFGDGGNQWLLVKMDGPGADRRRDPAHAQVRSVLSGRTNADLVRR